LKTIWTKGKHVLATNQETNYHNKQGQPCRQSVASRCWQKEDNLDV